VLRDECASEVVTKTRASPNDGMLERSDWIEMYEWVWVPGGNC
jgi:hypothetical protein